MRDATPHTWQGKKAYDVCAMDNAAMAKLNEGLKDDQIDAQLRQKVR